MSKIVLGLDPGTATTGYGVVVAEGDNISHVAHGCITTPAKTDLAQRLHTISKELKKIIKEYQPDLVAIEDLFFCKNVTTAIAVAQARGVLLEVTAAAKLPMVHYTPLQVKQALTGHGQADKRQMQKMIKIVLGMQETPKPDDAADALAIAVTGATSHRLEEMIK